MLYLFIDGLDDKENYVCHNIDGICNLYAGKVDYKIFSRLRLFLLWYTWLCYLSYFPNGYNNSQFY